jgi:flagellum-specific ATP synthase
MNARALIDAIAAAETVARTGRVRKILATHVEADGPNVSRGALCTIETRDARGPVLAEVVRVERESVLLMPFADGPCTFSGAEVRACPGSDGVPVGDAYLGRAVDPFGAPIDGKGTVRATERASLAGAEVATLDRTSPTKVLETGIRAIDGLLTIGHGQRIGIFAASGVGKTSLMAQLTRQVQADRIVLCLVGERGREVEALWCRGLSAEAKARAVLVAATSDQAAAMRVRAGDYAIALAEHWRSRGEHVVLFLDSVTRLAMAMREIGLAAGEPPTVRAYTPSVFAAIPKLVERCGAVRGEGSITALMTVLSETDDVDDPVAEMMKSLLDGHIILSRRLAEQGHYPAIDVPRSISRLASDLAPETLRAAATNAVALLSTYDNARTLIESGVYAEGSSPDIDRAVARRPALLGFLKQRQDERTPYSACGDALALAVGNG